MKNQKPKIIFGIDEVGRGTLAGPVVACAIVKLRAKNEKLKTITKSSKLFKDSKKLSLSQREYIYKSLQHDKLIEWGIGKVGERVIDKINILEATKLAMQKAVLALEKKIGKQADMLLIDGNFGIDMDRAQESIIKGDEKVFLISLASIIAKVHRDRLMVQLDKKYPQYGFATHKGYGTKAHFATLATHGPCPCHRASFYPVSQFSPLLPRRA